MFMFRQCFTKSLDKDPEILETKIETESFVIVEVFEDFKDKMLEENNFLKNKIEELTKTIESQDIKIRKIDSCIRKNSKRLSKRIESTPPLN